MLLFLALATLVTLLRWGTDGFERASFFESLGVGAMISGMFGTVAILVAVAAWIL